MTPRTVGILGMIGAVIAIVWCAALIANPRFGILGALGVVAGAILFAISATLTARRSWTRSHWPEMRVREVEQIEVGQRPHRTSQKTFWAVQSRGVELVQFWCFWGTTVRGLAFGSASSLPQSRSLCGSGLPIRRIRNNAVVPAHTGTNGGARSAYRGRHNRVGPFAVDGSTTDSPCVIFGSSRATVRRAAPVQHRRRGGAGRRGHRVGRRHRGKLITQSSDDWATVAVGLALAAFLVLDCLWASSCRCRRADVEAIGEAGSSSFPSLTGCGHRSRR